MADDEVVLKLRDRAKTLLIQVEKARQDFEYAAESGELDAVRVAFREQLSSQWSKLDLIINDEINWSELDEEIKSLELFTVTFQQIILHPRRAQLERQLSNSFITSDKNPLRWDLFLAFADDHQLDNIQGLGEQITDVRLDESVVQDLWQKWIAYQLESLIAKEKTVGILIDWLRHLVENLGEAQLLDQFIRNDVVPTTEASDHPIILQIRLQWLNELSSKIGSINHKQHQLGLGGLTENASEDWQSLQQVLVGFSISSRDLNEPEAVLIQRDLNNWGSVGADSIDVLRLSLDELSNIKHALRSSPQLFEEILPLSQPPVVSIEKLLSDRPMVPITDKNETFQTYLGAFNDFNEAALVWLERLGKEKARLLNGTIKWGSRVEDPVIESEVKAIQKLLSNEISLNQLADSHNRFLSVRGQVQEALHTQLSSDEEQVLAAILDKEALGQLHVSAIELTDQISLEELMPILASLANKEIVHIEVSTI